MSPKPTVAALQEQVAALQEQVDELRAEIEALKEQLNAVPPIQWVAEVKPTVLPGRINIKELFDETFTPFSYYSEEEGDWSYHGYL